MRFEIVPLALIHKLSEIVCVYLCRSGAFKFYKKHFFYRASVLARVLYNTRALEVLALQMQN